MTPTRIRALPPGYRDGAPRAGEVYRLATGELYLFDPVAEFVPEAGDPDRLRAEACIHGQARLVGLVGLDGSGEGLA